MDSFSQFISDGIALDPAAVRTAGLVARPFPECASQDEVVALARLLGAGRAECWHWGYQEKPHHLVAAHPDEAARHVFDFGYHCVLISFESVRTHLWLPDEHEFFVIFAPASTMEKICSVGIFTYDYNEYAREAFFAGKRSDYLMEAGRRYTIDVPNDFDNPDLIKVD